MPHSTSYILHSTLKCKFYILHFTFYIIFAFAMMSCTKSTSPKTGSLSGRVILVNDTDDPSLDPVDFSGVTVALYGLAVLDTTIVRINHEYPQIGVQISQETEFDHRNSYAIAEVQTDADGQFLFPNLAIGHYNIVVEKEGWSMKYIIDVSINEGANHISTRFPGKDNDVILYPVRHLPNVITDDIVFQSDRLYIVENDTSVLSHATIQNNTWICIAPGKRLEFHGSVNGETGSGFWRITSSSGFITSSSEGMLPFDYVAINSDYPTDVRGLIFEHSQNGLRCLSGRLTISDSIMRENNNFALILNGSSSSIVNSLIMSNPQKAITSLDSMYLATSILYSNGDACYMSESIAIVEKNYMVKNYIGLRPFYGTVTIANNAFDGNSNAIAPCASDPVITRNNFYGNLRDVELNGYYVQSYLDYCNPIISYNNFFGAGFYFHLRGQNSVYGDSSITGVNQDQSYPFNYFRASNLLTHIYDSSYPGVTFAYNVNILPRSLSPVATAGI